MVVVPILANHSVNLLPVAVWSTPSAAHDSSVVRTRDTEIHSCIKILNKHTTLCGTSIRDMRCGGSY